MLYILFVCTGNTCRSPMAEGFMKSVAAPEKFRTASAGIAAVPGAPASAHAVTVMRESGMDISAHRSSPFSDRHANEYDIILTMEDGHRDMVLDQYRFTKGKVYTIREFIGGSGAVRDPFGGPLESYRACRDELQGLVSDVLKKLEDS